MNAGMAWTLGTAAAFTALLLACVLGSVSAGIQYTTGIEYPGFTGVIPACAQSARSRMPTDDCLRYCQSTTVHLCSNSCVVKMRHGTAMLFLTLTLVALQGM